MKYSSATQEIYWGTYSCNKPNTHEVIFQPGQELFPKDDAGNVIYADINSVDTWKVCIVICFYLSYVFTNIDSLRKCRLQVYNVLFSGNGEVRRRRISKRHRSVQFQQRTDSDHT